MWDIEKKEVFRNYHLIIIFNRFFSCKRLFHIRMGAIAHKNESLLTLWRCEILLSLIQVQGRTIEK